MGVEVTDLKTENGVLREQVKVLEQQLRDYQPVTWDAELKQQLDELIAESEQLKAELQKQKAETVSSDWDIELKRLVDELMADNEALKAALVSLKDKYREAQDALAVQSQWKQAHD